MQRDELFKLSRENLEWFKENYNKLKRKYDNQWIVIQKKEVVATSSTYDDIIKFLKEKSDKKSAIVEFMDSKQMAMFF